MTVRNVMFAVLAEIPTVGIDYSGSIEINARHLFLVHWNHDDHMVLGRNFLH